MIQKKAKSLLNHGHILATEIADALTLKGLPFREAYALVATMVEAAEAQNIQVHELKNSDLKSITDKIDETFFESLSFESTVEKRNFSGGTSKAQVQSQIKNLK